MVRFGSIAEVIGMKVVGTRIRGNLWSAEPERRADTAFGPGEKVAGVAQMVVISRLDFPGECQVSTLASAGVISSWAGAWG